MKYAHGFCCALLSCGFVIAFPKIQEDMGKIERCQTTAEHPREYLFRCVIHSRALQWRHNELAGVSNNQPHHCLLKRLFGCQSKKISKLCVTGLCEGNSPVTGEFPAQMASNAENVSIWWRHHGLHWDTRHQLISVRCKHATLMGAVIWSPLNQTTC